MYVKRCVDNINQGLDNNIVLNDSSNDSQATKNVLWLLFQYSHLHLVASDPSQAEGSQSIEQRNTKTITIFNPTALRQNLLRIRKSSNLRLERCLHVLYDITRNR